MTNKHLLRYVAAFAITLLTVTAHSQNVGIGQVNPASKLDLKGNLTVGSAYSGTAAPANGAIIQGNVGIGNSSPSSLLTIGTTAPVTVDASGNVKISSLSSGNILMTGAGGLVTTVSAVGVANGGTGSSSLTTNGILYGNGTGAVGVTAAGTSGQVLTNVSGVPTWSTVTATTVGGWSLTGNSGTTAGTNFIGTTDTKDFVIKTDGFEAMRVSNGGGSAPGNVVIGSGDNSMSLLGGTLRAPSYGSALIGNATGVNLTIESGAPTGKAGSGSIIFQALAANIGSPGNTPDLSIMAEVMRITNTGAVSFGSTGTATGNANNVLISGGNSTNPGWGQLPLNDATNAVTGTLAVGNGGTGLSLYTAGSLLDASSTGVVGQIADVAAGSYLRSVAAGSVPVWSTLTLPNAATKGDILYASGTNAIGNLSDIATGNVLISGGVGAAPSWGQVALGTAVSGILPIANGGTNSGTALSGSGIMISNGSQIVQGTPGTTTTVLHGNASGAPAYSAVSLTTDVTGTLPVANGGTGATTLTSHGIIYGNGTSAVGVTAAGTNGQILTNSSGTPLWTTATYPATTTANQLLYSNAANTVTGLGVGTTGQVLTSNSSGVPTWATITSVLGTGTTNYVTRWTSGTTLGTGIIEDNGTTAAIDNAPNGTDLLYINNSAGNATTSALHATTTSGIDFYFGYEPSFTLASGQVCSSGIGAFCNSTAGNALVSSTSVAGGSGIIGNSTVGKGVYGITGAGSQGALAGYPYGAIVGLATNTTSGIGVIGIGNGANTNANSDIPTAGSGGAFMGSTRGVFAEYTNTTGGGAAIEGLTANGVDPTFSSTSQDFGVLGMGSTTGTDAAVAGYVGTFATPSAAAGVYGSSSSATVYAIYANNTSGTGVNGNGLFVSGTSAFQGTATLGVSSSNTGVLIYDNSSNANTITIQSGATSASYSLTLPTAVATANGQVLTSTTAGVLSWTTPSGSGVTSVTASSPLASSGGTTPNISLTGTVPVANGGTNLTSYTAGSLLDASATTTVGQIADVTAGSYLRSAGSGSVPVWSTLTLPNAATTGDILYASGTNAIGNLSDVATGDVLISGGVGAVPSYGKVALTSAVSGILPIANGGTNLSTTPTNGQLLIGNGTDYTLGTLTAGSNITITNASGTITIASTGGTPGWALTGNSGTTAGTNFIGTTDAVDFEVKTGTTPTERMHFVNSSGNVVIGSGEGTATVVGNTLRGPNAVGTNLAGVDFTIAGGNGTGTGGGGDVVFQTSPIGTTGTTANTLTERVRINYAGNVIIGSGDGTGTVAGNTLRGPNAVGTNLSGVDFTIAGGNGTGTGGGGDVVFQTSPIGTTGTTANTLTERVRINYAGNVIIGSGDGTGTVAGNTLRGPNAVGTNLAGVDFTIAGGNGTGTGGGGDVVFQTSPVGTTGTTANTLTERVRINYAGNVIIGSGDGTGTVAGNTLRGPNAVGTNITGANLTITSGDGTGNAGSGNIIFQTAPTGSSGTTANTMAEAMRITPTGIVAIGTTTPASDATIAIANGHIEVQQTTASTSTIGATAEVGSGFGANAPSVTLTNASDEAGTISLTTGSTAPTGTGTLLTLNFNQAYTTAPVVVLTPTNAAAAAGQSTYSIFVASSATGFTISNATTHLPASSTYSWNYYVIEPK